MEDFIHKLNYLHFNAESFPIFLRSFIQSGGDVNGICEDLPYLHCAIITSNVVAVRLLLEAGADVNRNSSKGFSPLHFVGRAQSEYTLEIATLLLDHGADQLVMDNTGRTPLHLAFSERKSSLVKLLLKRLPKGVNPTDRSGLSAFHIACAHGVDDVVRDMLENGIEINHCALGYQNNHLNGIHFAVLDNRKSTVELLLQYGANVHESTGSGETLLHLASGCNVEKLVSQYNGREISNFENLDETLKEQLDIINLLLDHGVNIDAIDKNGYTPLVYANYTLFTHIYSSEWRETLQKPSIIPFYYFHENNYDYTNYSLYEYKNPRRRLIVQHLLERGADVNARCPVTRKSCLQLFFQAPIRQTDGIDVEIPKLLIKHGADVNAHDERGFTPLHSLVDQYDFTKKFFENVTLLLNHGADVNAVDIDGRTPVSLLIETYDSLIKGDLRTDVVRDSLKAMLVQAQRLLTLGLPVQREIRDCLKKRTDLGDFASVEKECADELRRMKEFHVQIQCKADTSLYRILWTGRDEADQCLNESELQAIIEKYEIASEYPHYAKWFKLRIRRKFLMRRAEWVIKLIARCELPYLCIEQIFKHLTDSELNSLKKINSMKRKRVDPADVTDEPSQKKNPRL